MLKLSQVRPGSRAGKRPAPRGRRICALCQSVMLRKRSYPKPIEVGTPELTVICRTASDTHLRSCPHAGCAINGWPTGWNLHHLSIPVPRLRFSRKFHDRLIGTVFGEAHCHARYSRSPELHNPYPLARDLPYRPVAITSIQSSVCVADLQARSVLSQGRRIVQQRTATPSWLRRR
jgi:hypothetical protein